MSGLFRTDENGFVHAYVQGASLDNGTDNGVGGMGIWFENGHALNATRPVPCGHRAKGNAAEILAVTLAVEMTARAGVRRLVIHTDSLYVISCVSMGIPQLLQNETMMFDDEELVNREELTDLQAALDTWQNSLTVYWNLVTDSPVIHGHVRATKMANRAAAIARDRDSIIEPDDVHEAE